MKNLNFQQSIQWVHDFGPATMRFSTTSIFKVTFQAAMTWVCYAGLPLISQACRVEVTLIPWIASTIAI